MPEINRADANRNVNRTGAKSGFAKFSSWWTFALWTVLGCWIALLLVRYPNRMCVGASDARPSRGSALCPDTASKIGSAFYEVQLDLSALLLVGLAVGTVAVCRVSGARRLPWEFVLSALIAALAWAFIRGPEAVALAGQLVVWLAVSCAAGFVGAVHTLLVQRPE